MKLNYKSTVESTEQLNLRIPASLRKRMDNTRARAAKLGIDYNATLVANLDEFEKEFDAHVTACERTSVSSASEALAELKSPAADAASSNGSASGRGA
jgi:hypothetical protein